MRSSRALTAAGLATVFTAAIWFQRTPAATLAHRFEKVTDDVYVAMGNGTVNTGSNAVVIINKGDVVVVDPGITPAAGRALIEDIKALTPKPVGVVVDTHYHFDHAHANQVFGMDVLLIGHEYTRQVLQTDVLNGQVFHMVTDPIPDQIAALKRDQSGERDPAKRQQLASRIAAQETYLEQLREIRPTPPNVTFPSHMSLYRGAREFQLYFMGRAHTGGDIVVFLPNERILCTGDIMTNMPTRLSYMGDGFVNDWPQTLENLMSLDFDTVIPGHGEPFKGKDEFKRFQSVLRDLWTQAVELRKQGLSATEAAKRIDLTKHRDVPQIKGLGIELNEMTRMYDVMDGRVMPR